MHKITLSVAATAVTVTALGCSITIKITHTGCKTAESKVIPFKKINFSSALDTAVYTYVGMVAQKLTISKMNIILPSAI